MKKPRVLDLNEAIQHPGKTLTFDVESVLDEEPDLDLAQPIKGKLNAISTGNLLMINGDFETVVILECARCLSPIEVPIKFSVEEEFDIHGVPSRSGGKSFAQVQNHDDEFENLFSGNALLYEELLRQNIWLNIPEKPLCKENCEELLVQEETLLIHHEFDKVYESLQKKESKT